MEQRSRQRKVASALFAAGALLCAACSSGDDDASGGDTATADDSGRTTDRTQPPGTEADAVEPYITELLVRYDAAVNALNADPALADDEEDPAVKDYLAVFGPGSEQVDLSFESWQADAEAGTTVEPLDPEHPAIETILDGAIEVVSEDEVRFPKCEAHRYIVRDGEGNEVERVQLTAQPGQGVAVRVDGTWYLQELEIWDDMVGCRSQGEIT